MQRAKDLISIANATKITGIWAGACAGICGGIAMINGRVR